ncbi:MAG TPA: response regulator [Roseiflexaceae bacterium]|nr:response regulator [Roseiflexaceae bacterium]
MATILVIEDDLYIQALLQELLGDEGYTVVVVGDGPEGLAELDVQPVDLVLCDLMLPTLGGREVLRAIRARPHCVLLPVVLISATNNILPSDSQDFTAVMRKPFQINNLLNLIERVLGQRQLSAGG